jgi:hypothetical protein
MASPNCAFVLWRWACEGNPTVTHPLLKMANYSLSDLVLSGLARHTHSPARAPSLAVLLFTIDTEPPLGEYPLDKKPQGHA